MIGWDPVVDDIRLTNGDFIVSRTSPDGPIPEDTEIEIVWATSPSPTTWAGEIDGDTVSWRIEAEDVADIPTDTAFSIYVHYPNGETATTDDYEWIVGCGRRYP